MISNFSRKSWVGPERGVWIQGSGSVGNALRLAFAGALEDVRRALYGTAFDVPANAHRAVAADQSRQQKILSFQPFHVPFCYILGLIFCIYIFSNFFFAPKTGDAKEKKMTGMM